MTLGIIVSSMGKNQLSHHLGETAENLKRDDVVVFFENIAHPWIVLPFATMNISEAYNFRSPTVATSLITAERLLNFPGPTRKFLYVWDLEWFRTSLTYEEMTKVYNNPKISLIARSTEHAEAIKDAWNREVIGVVPNGDVVEMVRVVNAYGKK